MSTPFCRDENMLAGVVLHAFLAVACSSLVALVLAASSCAPSLKRASVSVDPAGLSLEEQREAVAFVESGISGEDLRGWRIGVLPYPLTFDPPLLTGDFGVVTSATSITFLDRREIVLTWRRLPDGTLDVEDLPWELSKVRDFAQRNP